MVAEGQGRGGRVPRAITPARRCRTGCSWEASDLEAAGRAHWLVIDELGATRTDAPLPDVNELEAAPNRRLMFERRRQPGRVDLVRTGNLVEATTSGVRRFTLLLSPDQFDFSQPVRVTVNGRPAFEGRVEPSTNTLLKWAARDNDRTMLFGAADFDSTRSNRFPNHRIGPTVTLGYDKRLLHE